MKRIGRMKRIVAALSAALMIAGALLFLGACSEEEKEEESLRVIGTCEGLDVYYEELRYITLTRKRDISLGAGRDVWADPADAAAYRDELETAVRDAMRNNYATLALCRDYGIDPSELESDRVLSAVETQINQALRSSGSPTAFAEALEESFLTEHLARFLFAVSELENELYDKMVARGELADGSDPAVLEAFLASMDETSVYVNRVAVLHTPGTEREKNRSLAEEIRASLADGTRRVSDYASDPPAANVVADYGVYLLLDVDDPTLVSAGRALAVGEISPVIEAADGDYILIRVEDSESNRALNLSSLFSSAQWAKLDRAVAEKKEQITVDYNDFGDGIDLLEVE